MARPLPKHDAAFIELNLPARLLVEAADGVVPLDCRILSRIFKTTHGAHRTFMALRSPVGRQAFSDICDMVFSRTQDWQLVTVDTGARGTKPQLLIDIKRPRSMLDAARTIYPKATAVRLAT